MAKKLLHYDGSRECLPQKCLLVIAHRWNDREAFAFFTDKPAEQLTMNKDYHSGWSTSISPELLTEVLPKRNTNLTIRGWVERVRGKQPAATIPMKGEPEEPKPHHQNLEQKIVDAFVLVMEEYGYKATPIKSGNGYYCFKLEPTETTKKPVD